MTDFGFNSVAGEIQQTGRNTDHGKMAALLGAYNAVVIESYVDRYGTIQYALCQSVMDSLQRKLKDMSNEFYEKKKFGLPEELASNKANATIYSTRHQAVANRKNISGKKKRSQVGLGMQVFKRRQDTMVWLVRVGVINLCLELQNLVWKKSE